jgi:4-hydroxybenzoate polyprenyltransferase
MNTIENDQKHLTIYNDKNSFNDLSFFSILTKTRIFLALNGMFVYIFSALLCGFPPDPFLLESSFLITLAVYTFNLVTDLSEDEINRSDQVIDSKTYLGISISALILGIFFNAIKGVYALIIGGLPLILGLFYSVKIFPWLPRIKEVLGAKSLIVASSWALTGSILPTVTASIRNEKIIFNFLYIFINLLVNTIIFDIKDIEGDSRAGVKTIPVVLGRGKTIKLLYIINSSLIILLFYALLNPVFSHFIPILIFGTIYGYLLIHVFGNDVENRLKTEIFVDGEWIPNLILAIFVYIIF